MVSTVINESSRTALEYALRCDYSRRKQILIVTFPVFFVFLDKTSELPCCFIEASSEIGWGIKYLQAKQSEHARVCKDYVTGRERTTVLKLAVDNVILEICDSCDYFASPLLL